MVTLRWGGVPLACRDYYDHYNYYDDYHDYDYCDYDYYDYDHCDYYDYDSAPDYDYYFSWSLKKGSFNYTLHLRKFF